MAGADGATPAFERRPVRLFRIGVALFFLQEIAQITHGDQGIGMLRAQSPPFRLEGLPHQLLGLGVVAFRSEHIGQIPMVTNVERCSGPSFLALISSVSRYSFSDSA